MTGNTPSPSAATGRLTSLIDTAAESHGRAILFLATVSLLALLPGFVEIPPIDRDETLFAQVTKQMLETGDYVDLRFQNSPLYKKPAGVNWVQAGVVKAAAALGVPRARTRIWLYRIPSLLGALGAVLLTYWAALAFLPRRGAVLAGLFVAVSLMLGIQGRLARTDALLLVGFAAVLGAMGRSYLAPRGEARHAAHVWVGAAVFWTALAGGTLLKGPYILLFVGLVTATLGVLDRSLRWIRTLKPLPGIAWCAALVVPWAVAIAQRAGTSFFASSIGQDTLGKMVRVQESHGGPPGYYLGLFFLTFWPGSILAILAVPAVWAQRRHPAFRFLLAWIVPAWLVCEVVATKLPHYILPLFPAIAILIASTLAAGQLAQTRWLVWATGLWFWVPAALGVLGLAGRIVLAHDWGLLVWPWAAAAAVLGWWAWRRYGADGPETASLRAAAAALCLSVTVYGGVFPALTLFFPSAAVAETLRESGCLTPEATAVGYTEPSLVFLLGTGTQFTDPQGATRFLAGGECRFAIVESRFVPAFTEETTRAGVAAMRVAQVDGINVSHMRPLSLMIYRARP